jgi:hypothetical protein
VLDTCDSELSQQQCFLDNSDLLTPACLELVSPAETPLGKLSLMLTEHDGLAYIYGKDTRVVQIDLNRLDDASSPRVAFVFPYGLYYHTATTYYDPVNYRVFTAAMDGLSNMILETDFLRRTYYGTVVDSAVQGQVLYVIPRSPASTTGPAPLIVGALLLSVVTWLR